MDCQAQGELPIRIRWLKNGSPIVESDRVYQLSNGSLFISETESRKGEKSDEGSYQCLAQNEYGAILSQKARLTIASISTFTQQPSSIVVKEGSVARFTCRISAVPPPIITWEFNRVTLPLATDRITVLPGGVLQIQSVDQKDAGNYRCVATNIASRRRSMEATLTVAPAPFPRIPQRPHIIAGPQNLTVATHSSALLECMAVGNPRPLISWSRADHKPIDVYNTKVLGNGNLLISDVKRQHAGIYVCRATTPGTRNFTLAAANVTVLEPPSLVEWPESLTRPRAGTGRFVCQAEGMPTPRITWLKNGEQVHSNGRIKMYNSKLVINQIIPEDDAIYQCQAENEQGSVLSTARLIVVMSEDRPSAPRNIQADTVSSSAILLAWERPAYNADKVIAYSIHYMKAEGLNNEEYQVVIGNDTTRYIVDDLESAQNYTFYIVAYMPMGASRMSDHVIQHTLEDVPLRAPELSLTSRSPTNIQVSWLPLPPKLSRGHVSAYRLWYRAGTEGATTQLELPGDQTWHILESLQPDTVYLLRIAASTSTGWGEPCAWTSHRTPKTSSKEVRWRLAPGSSVAGLQGFRLFYHEENQPESMPIQIPPHINRHIIGGLDPRKKYHVKLLAFSFAGEGYQSDRTISTPGCVSVRDRLVPPPPPPHHVFARANSSSSVYLQWAQPAFTITQTVNYTVRCNPSLLVNDLQPNTRYEFAVRLHVDLLSIPDLPPTGVKVTLIEGDTALVSWKAPSSPNIAVTRYTILYASRKAWLAGEWQILQREGVKSCTIKDIRQSQTQAPPTTSHTANENQAESSRVLVPVMREHFIDAKGGTDLIINSYGPVRASAERKRAQKWRLFRKDEKSSGSPSLQPPSSLHTLLGPPGGDSEGSHSSEGSHETGESGLYSHDEHDLANLSAQSFTPLSEYAPPPNPSSDHLVASNPFDDNYNSPPASLKPVNTTSPYLSPAPYPGFGGYGPPRMVPHIHNRMPAPFGSPFQIRNQPHPFAQNPVGPMGFNRAQGFNYAHPENPAFANQNIFNNSNVSVHQHIRPCPGENLNPLSHPNLNQNHSPDPMFGPEVTAGMIRAMTAMKPGPVTNPGLNFPPPMTPKQEAGESGNKNATPPRKPRQLLEEGGAQESQAELKGKNGSSIEGSVEKINGVLHPNPELLKKSLQPVLENSGERIRRPASNKSGSANSKRSRLSGSAPSEPLYPCGICLGEVNDDQEAILCEASCQKWFHRVCTGMTETAYNLLTAETAAVALRGGRVCYVTGRRHSNHTLNSSFLVNNRKSTELKRIFRRFFIIIIVMPLLITDHSWTQTESSVFLCVPLKAVKPAKVDVLCTEEYLKVSFPPFLFEAFFFQLIDEEKSVAKIGNGVANITLVKQKSGLWEQLSVNIEKDTQREIRERAIAITQKKEVEKEEVKARRIQQEKKYTLEVTMKIEEEEQAKIQRMKDVECTRAIAELKAWKEKKRQVEEEEEARRRQQELAATQERKQTPQHGKPEKTKTPEPKPSRAEGEKSGGKKCGQVNVPASRSAGSIQISFTPRVFPTPSRESYIPEEEEWLRKQAEARRAANADLAELDKLTEKEKNPDWLKEKGDKFFSAGNYSAALNAYDLGIKLNRRIPALFSNRAACHLKLRNLHKAIEDSSQALELLTPAVPDNAAARVKAHVRRGTAFCQLELYVEGLQDYQAALRIEPHNQTLQADTEKIREIIQGTTPTTE
ncbi:Protogenin A [Bagarius yarrelli]|uniref:Dynein axonemal assembly factor 4 n=1 Tax=Bagarius yarrelli TaxID=175774 RepID=A0A556VAF5_BAGYA|nr:Protogenin A [Bagarius yarrelli]